jgi:hypothetical protein
VNHVTQHQIAVEELGWRRADGCWQLPEHPSFGFLSQVLYYEWQQALARAGRADHEVARLRLGINAQLVFFAVIAVATIAGLALAFH